MDDEYIASWFSYSPVSKARRRKRRAWSRARRPPRRHDFRPDLEYREMRIAILGTRGIPANYGGFETFAEELSVHGWRRADTMLPSTAANVRRDPIYRGVHLQYLPTIRHKYFDTLAHTLVSTLHLLAHRADVALYCNGANADLHALAAAGRHAGGAERGRHWSASARSGTAWRRAWYHVSEWLATFLPNEVVTDARAIQTTIGSATTSDSTFIPYGAETGKVPSTAALERLGLEPGRYFLYVSRMEPENHPLEVRQAFESVRTDMRLALIGDAPYAEDYIQQVRDTRDPRVVMPGAIYGEGYRELGSHCFAYIHATEVGGTHPALIEAMGRGALVLYRNNAENAEVAGDAGIPFDDDLAAKIELVLAMPEEERDALRRRALERVQQRYCWDAVTSSMSACSRR